MKLSYLFPLMFSVLFSLSHVAQAEDEAKPYVGDTIEYRANYEDTFVHLARDYKLGFVEMRAANPNVDPWLPGEGTNLILPTRHIFPDAPQEGIVINLPEMRLYAFLEGKAPVSFPLGVEREGLETPVGSTSIVRKMDGPTWTPTARMRKEDPLLKQSYAPGPDNPLGTHALYLGWPTYAIHGTNRPFGIGRRVSSGCIRMYPEDIITFFDMIPVGTKVTVVDQPIKVAWIDDKLYIEAHPSLEHSLEMEETARIAAPKLTDADMERIIEVAGEYKDKIRWAAVRTAIRERKGYPVDIARRSSYDVDAAIDEEAVSEDSAMVESLKAEEQAALEEARNKAKEVLEEIYSGHQDVQETSAPSSYSRNYETRTLNP